MRKTKNTGMDELLWRWADWAASGRVVSGLGYAQCQYDKWLTPCTFRPIDPKIDEEASNTESAVMMLPEQLRDVVIAYYTGKGSVRQKAKDCHMSVQTLYNRLEHAWQRLPDLIEQIQRRRKAWIVQSTFNKSA